MEIILFLGRRWCFGLQSAVSVIEHSSKQGKKLKKKKVVVIFL